MSMSVQSVVLFLSVVAAAMAGCGQSPPRVLDAETFDAGLDPRDPRIVDLVSRLKQNSGITLQSEGGGTWTLVEPAIQGDYDIRFIIRSFPAWATEEQMREALDVNLAYQLNVHRRLAMSYAGFHGRNSDSELPASDDQLPKVNGLPVTKAVEQFFMAY